MATTYQRAVIGADYTEISPGIGEVLITSGDQPLYWAISASKPAPDFLGHYLDRLSLFPLTTPGNKVWAKSFRSDGSDTVAVTE